MKTRLRVPTASLALLSAFSAQPLALPSAEPAFEGRIRAVITRGGETQTFRYTIGAHQLRIERTETNRPHARNIVDRQTGAVTLLFPHNRSFVRVEKLGQNAAAPFPGAPGMPLPPGGVPPGIGPQTASLSSASAPPNALSMPALPQTAAPPASIGLTNLPGVPAPPSVPLPSGGPPPGIGPQPGIAPGAPLTSAGMPAMPVMPPRPMMPGEQAELRATGEKTNLLGYACERFELKQRGDVMEVWATDKLLPFQPWLPNQPPRFGPRMLEEQWPQALKAKKLFPLLAVLESEAGPERLRFEVKTITSEKIADPEGKLFQPPPDYHEIEPLPF